MARHREFDEQQVIERAMHAFWAGGYRETTPQKLVEATGLSKSSLYATFGSKRGLFLAALDQYVSDQERMGAALLADGTLREGLQRFYAALVGMNTAPREARCCLVATSSMDVPADDAEALARVAEGQRAMGSVFAARFRRARQEGELPSDADPDALARFVISSNMGMQVTARAGAPREHLEQIAARIIDAVC